MRRNPVMIPGAGILACCLAGPAAAAPLELPPTGWLMAGLLALIGVGLLGTLTLAGLAWRRSLRPPPPGLSRAELEELRRAVSAFAGLLREGTAMLLQQQQQTLDSVEAVAAHSQQLIALIAGSEARLSEAAARGEILATRVARSAAAEVKASVESLTAISARIEHQARGLEAAIRLADARAA